MTKPDYLPAEAPAGWPNVRLPAKLFRGLSHRQIIALKTAEHQVAIANGSVDAAPARSASVKSCLVGRFRKLWAELHTRALATDPPDPQIEADWLRDWVARIQCPTCESHWRLVIADCPPRLDTRDDYFAWTVDAHNAVNRHLGKPELTLDAARERWGIA